MQEFVLMPKQVLIDAIQHVCYKLNEAGCDKKDCLNCIPGSAFIEIVSGPPRHLSRCSEDISTDDMAKAIVKNLCKACEMQNHCDQYSIDGCAQTDKVFRSSVDEIKSKYASMLEASESREWPPPCPFCGSKARTHSDPEIDTLEYAKCSNPACSLGAEGIWICISEWCNRKKHLRLK